MPLADRAARGRRREVHRRRRDGRLRRAARSGAKTPSGRSAPVSSILEGIEELNERHAGLDLAVRAAVCTGEAVVAMDAAPGDPLATGDVVNTAARLQSAAAPGSLVVDDGDARAHEARVRFEELPAVDAKGKAEPVAAWSVVEHDRGAGEPADLRRAVRRPRTRARAARLGVGASGRGRADRTW